LRRSGGGTETNPWPPLCLYSGEVLSAGLGIAYTTCSMMGPVQIYDFTAIGENAADLFDGTTRAEIVCVPGAAPVERARNRGSNLDLRLE
jgi:hypothetical protein